MPFKISASLASSPLAHLEKTLRELVTAGADYIHFDVEDGSFVPAMTLGTRLIPALRPFTSLPFDVHLMMASPEWILPELVGGGADRISVHYEACAYPRRVLRQIVSLGAQAGLAFNPATPLPDLAYLAPYLSFIVILTTEPEGPDCPFLPEMLEKIRAGRQACGLEGLKWVADGGITPENAARVAAAGADTLVVGRALFAGDRIAENLAALRRAA